MRSEFMVDAKVDIECKKCGNRSSFFALRVVPGIKCLHCGAVLPLGENEYIAKSIMLQAAADKNDVRVI